MTRKLVTIAVVIAAGAIGAWYWRSTASSDTAGVPVESMSQLPSASSLGAAVNDAHETLSRLIAGNPGGTPIPAEERTRRARAIVDQVRAVSRLVPRETFDIGLVARQIGREPAQLHRWVRDHTVRVAYRGSLRGAQGALMDRRGNSLDRALLLAGLLTVHDVPVRLARASLTSEQVATFDQPPPGRASTSPEAAVMPEGLGAAIEAYARQSGANANEITEQLKRAVEASTSAADNVRRRVAAQTAMLVKALGLPASDPAGASSSNDTDALRDHWWVQWQSGSQWNDLDPDLATAGATIAPAEATSDPQSLPDDLHHKIELRVIVEKWDGSALQEASAVTGELVPSKLLGETIRLQHVPMAWPKDVPKEAVKDVALEQHEWLPVITIGTGRIAASSILDTGDLNTRPGSTPAPAASASMVDAFGGGGGEPGVLTAEWIEYEIRSPGRSPRTIRREVFDLIGPAARAEGRGPKELTDELRLSRALNMLGETEIVALACQPSAEFVTDLAVTRFLALDDLLRRAGDHPKPGQTSDVAALPGPLHGLAVARDQWSRRPGRLSLTEPNLLSRHIYPVVDPAGSVGIGIGIDIVANAVSFRGDAEAHGSSIEQGVLDANLEAMMAGSAAAGGSLADLFGSDSSPKWLTVRTTADLARAGVPADLRARIETDLHAGFIVVTPREPSSMEAVGWWRVDPRTGDTLSIGNRGWGQAQVESMGLNVTMAGVAIFGLCTLGVVLLGGSKDAAILCFAVGVTIAGGGIMVGGIAVGGFNGGAAFGIAAVQTLLSSAMVTWLGLSMLSH